MKIIIVGAGEVGFHIAARLASESKRVVVIDTNETAIKKLSEKLDVQTIVASGSDPQILIEAGIQEADIFLAVTNSDEVNLVACLMADTIAPKIKKLVRLRNPSFAPYEDQLKSDRPSIDRIINPETEVVNTICKLIQVPGALDVGSFMNGQVQYAGIRVADNSPLVGLRLMDFPAKFGDIRPLIAAIIRKRQVIVPGGADVIKAGDLIYFVCETRNLGAIMDLLNLDHDPIRNVLIVGGGRTGEKLARRFEKEGVKTKIIEADLDRCQYLSMQMKKATVLHGDGSDQTLFMEENAQKSDAIISVTNDDETNVLVSLLAKDLGVKTTVTRVEKSSYYPLLSSIGIEKVVSPRVSAVSSILQDVRKGQVLSDISIFGEKGEFIEAVALKNPVLRTNPSKKSIFPRARC